VRRAGSPFSPVLGQLRVMRTRLYCLCSIFAASLALMSCDHGDVDTADTGPGPGVDGGPPATSLADLQREILANTSTNIVVPALEDFVTAANALESAASAHAADPSAANREAAQGAFVDALAAWQRVELMQLGPTGMSGTSGAVGGMDLRDDVYTYERSSLCRLDQETVEGAYSDVDAFASELVNVRGLDAIEYLLFIESEENHCSPMSPINRDGTWGALGSNGLRDARAAYAATVATLVRRAGEAARDAWLAFAGDLATAGLAESEYPSAQAAFNDLGGAMLYLDTDTKDMKLAVPAGITGCMEAPCFGELETEYADVGAAAILENLRVFQRMYLGAEPGTDAPGWDDLLIEVGAEELNTMLADALTDAITATEALGPSLRDAITNNPADVMTAYDAISLVTRLFKTDVFTVLDIEPTGPRIGDND
jgi:uncharacterized protein